MSNDPFPAGGIFQDRPLEAILREYLKFGSADGPMARRLLRAELKAKVGMPLTDYEQDAVAAEATRRGIRSGNA